MIDSLLGRFRPLAERGRTSAATLYEARDELTGEPTSVVVLAPGSLRTLGEIHAFQRRAQAMASLGSAVAPRLLTWGMQDGVWYTAHAGAPGISLEQLSQRLGPLEPLEAFAIGALLFRTLSRLHARGLLLREVVPGSALLGPDGQVGVWNVCAGTPPKAAGATVMLSQLDFVKETYTPRDTGGPARTRDVYGAGMTIAYLLAGGAPARPANLQQLLAFVQRPSFTFPQPLPLALEAILLAAVAPRAEQRPPARRAYGAILAATGMTARQLERRCRQLVARLSCEQAGG